MHFKKYFKNKDYVELEMKNIIKKIVRTKLTLKKVPKMFVLNGQNWQGEKL